jgi:carbon monoxide dehydrogenase subunit G
MANTALNPTTGEEIELHDLTCTACSGEMDGHRCPGASFTVTTGAAAGSRSGKGSSRAKPADKPKCAQCNSVMHYNLGKGLENVLCAYIQWAVGTGKIVDPVADVRKLAALIPGDGTLTEVDDYAQANGLTFGKEAVKAGVITSYAAAKAVEAAANPKERAPRKGKGLAATVAEVQQDGEAVATDLSWENTVVDAHAVGVTNVGKDLVAGGEIEVSEVSEAAEKETRAAKKADLQRQRKAKMKSSRLTSVK